MPHHTQVVPPKRARLVDHFRPKVQTPVREFLNYVAVMLPVHHTYASVLEQVDAKLQYYSDCGSIRSAEAAEMIDEFFISIYDLALLVAEKGDDELLRVTKLISYFSSKPRVIIPVSVVSRLLGAAKVGSHVFKVSVSRLDKSSHQYKRIVSTYLKKIRQKLHRQAQAPKCTAADCCFLVPAPMVKQQAVAGEPLSCPYQLTIG
jgi:hypothetical protein